ncbi:methanethiol S-methyltransferase [Mycobacterium aquaticum]|uniref:methanethiol S-methyltransferase n=1 Tax=Mycobacterium aquaticum TaxID=1927124 RepID=A0A1X0BCD7_9MYCO|nr:methanethiol S-methyltransferase [Mycobacterium aquaticum]ORA40021.1 hypothetical protein BST13_01300 [Mycobacterium aquaticum]
MNRYFAMLYGAISYALFLAVFVYAIGFVGGLTPRSVDDAVAAPVVVAVVVDVLLMTLFAAQHSVMARPGFKKWWTRYVPTAVERSTYVLLASSALALLMWQWRSIPAVAWDIDWPPARITVWALFWLGWGIVLASTFMINHFELFGLRQVFNTARSQSETGFRTTLFYRVVRHPLNLGFIVAFWAAPTMTVAHLLFATVTTGWILLAIQLEERDLVGSLGARYAAYRETVPMLVPRLLGRRRTTRISPPAAQQFSSQRSARSVRR